MPDRAAPTAGLPRPQAEAPASAQEADARLARTRARHSLGTPANGSDPPRPGRPRTEACALPFRLPYRSDSAHRRRQTGAPSTGPVPWMRPCAEAPHAACRPGRSRRLGSRRKGQPRRQAPDRIGRGFKPTMMVTPGGRPVPTEWPPSITPPARRIRPDRKPVTHHQDAQSPTRARPALLDRPGGSQSAPRRGPRQGDEARRIRSPCTLQVAGGNGEVGRRRDPEQALARNAA